MQTEQINVGHLLYIVLPLKLHLTYNYPQLLTLLPGLLITIYKFLSWLTHNYPKLPTPITYHISWPMHHYLKLLTLTQGLLITIYKC